MKYVKQFLIIAAIAFVGEILNYLIPLPIPGSIYGMVILFIGLTTGCIPLSSVKETGKFLVEIMPMMFIPAAVGLMESWGVMKPIFLPIAVVVGLSTIVVMAAAGLSSQAIIHEDGGEQHE